MNERIKEIAEQAKQYARERMAHTMNPMLFSAEVFQEKFAELIVRECIQVAGPEDSYVDEWFKAKTDSVAKIKQHFGVEE